MSARQAVAFFVSRGWTPAQAAGIAANLQAEIGLNSAAAMQSPFRLKVGGVSFLWRRVKAKVDQLISHANACLKFILGGPNAKDPQPIVATGLTLVLRVEPVVGFAQVGYRVVRAVAVDVVDLVGGQLSVYVQPSEPVRSHSAVADLDDDISIESNMACDAARLGAPASPPSEYPARRVVVEQFAQQVCGNIVASHAASFLGRVVRAVSALARCHGPSILAVAK